MKYWLLTICGAIAITGCSKGPDQTSRLESTDPPSIEGGAETPPVSTNTDTTEPIKPTPDKGKETNNPYPGMPKINDPKPVAEPGTGGWQKSKLAASDFAGRVAASMKKLTDSQCAAVLSSKTPEGVGKHMLNYRFASPTAFRVEYVESGLIPKRSVIVANGQTVKAYANNAWGKAKPVAAGLQPEFAKAGTDRFLREFTRVMLTPVVDKSDGWSPLLASLINGSGGFESRVEERRMAYQGRNFTSFRVVATRRADVAKKLGPASIEVVVDGNRWLPVTIRTEETKPGGKPWSYEWAGNWRFGQKFKPEELGLVLPANRV